MAARDERLDAALAAGEEIVLWFESDLYDVLQLAQIADRVPPGAARIVLVGVDEFCGVAELSAAELEQQRPEPFEPAPYAALWSAFRAPDPRGLQHLQGPSVVRDAAHRHLQQFPWTTDGLNRTERALLEALNDGARTPEEAFLAHQRQEQRPFLGDTIAFDYIAQLSKGDARPERWLGGVHLPAGDDRWRYDPSDASIRPIS
jgi:hypothetical protein